MSPRTGHTVESSRVGTVARSATPPDEVAQHNQPQSVSPAILRPVEKETKRFAGAAQHLRAKRPKCDVRASDGADRL
jgi:hypothetical protein